MGWVVRKCNFLNYSLNLDIERRDIQLESWQRPGVSLKMNVCGITFWHNPFLSSSLSEKLSGFRLKLTGTHISDDPGDDGDSIAYYNKQLLLFSTQNNLNDLILRVFVWQLFFPIQCYSHWCEFIRVVQSSRLCKHWGMALILCMRYSGHFPLFGMTRISR